MQFSPSVPRCTSVWQVTQRVETANSMAVPRPAGNCRV
jgi:hypothetical protein